MLHKSYVEKVIETEALIKLSHVHFDSWQLTAYITNRSQFVWSWTNNTPTLPWSSSFRRIIVQINWILNICLWDMRVGGNKFGIGGNQYRRIKQFTLPIMKQTVYITTIQIILYKWTYSGVWYGPFKGGVNLLWPVSNACYNSFAG